MAHVVKPTCRPKLAGLKVPVLKQAAAAMAPSPPGWAATAPSPTGWAATAPSPTGWAAMAPSWVSSALFAAQILLL